MGMDSDVQVLTNQTEMDVTSLKSELWCPVQPGRRHHVEQEMTTTNRTGAFRTTLSPRD